MKEERKLIGSIDFGQKLKSKLGMWGLTYLNYFTIRDKFDLFLKQSLEIWMFIPCKLVDGVWVVLEEPNPNKVDYLYYIQEYQEAKERVLFEGFEYAESHKKGIDSNLNLCIFPYTETRFGITKKSEAFRTWFQLFTVEDLVQCDLTLTEDTAKKLGV